MTIGKQVLARAQETERRIQLDRERAEEAREQACRDRQEAERSERSRRLDALVEAIVKDCRATMRWSSQRRARTMFWSVLDREGNPAWTKSGDLHMPNRAADQRKVEERVCAALKADDLGMSFGAISDYGSTERWVSVYVLEQEG